MEKQSSVWIDAECRVTDRRQARELTDGHTSLKSSKIPVILQNLPAASLQISLLTFHNHFTYHKTQHYQISSHAAFCLMCRIIFFVLQLCYKIALLFFRQQCHVLIMYKWNVLNPSTQHLFRRDLTVVTWSVITPCARKNPKSQLDKSNVQSTSYNSV